MAEARSGLLRPAALLAECGSARFGYRQAAAQAGEIQEHSGHRASWGDHREPSSTASEAVVKLDQRAESTRVDEAHLSQIDEHGGSVLARRIR